MAVKENAYNCLSAVTAVMLRAVSICFSVIASALSYYTGSNGNHFEILDQPAER